MMSKNIITDDANTIVNEVVKAMQDKKAHKIISLDLREIVDSVSKYFVICEAPSSTQVDAIYNNVIDMVKENCNLKPFHLEGYRNSEWILIDYFDVVVHIFKNDIRDYYKLEDLWADAKLKKYNSDN